MADTLIDYSILKSQLSRSKLQATNPSAHQTIDSLIGGVKSFQDFVNVSFADQTNSLNSAIDQINKQITDLTTQLQQILSLNAIYLFEVDTRFGSVFFDLDANYTQGWLIVKDVYGHAFTNPIQLLGNVDGVSNPIFFTNYTSIKVYKSAIDDLYRTW